MDDLDTIISWVSVNNYPKGIDLLCYVFAVFGLPLLWYLLLRFVPRLTEKIKNFPLGEVTRFSEYRWSMPSIVFQWLLIPCGIYYLLYQPGLSGFLDLYHEGEKLAPVQMVQSGAVPYLDIYLQHGLIRNALLPILAAYFFGDTVEGVRLLHHLLEPLPYICLYCLGLLVFRGRFISSLLLVVVCSSLEYWIGLRQGLMLSVILLLLIWIRQLSFGREQNSLFLFTGFLSALTFWFSVDYGIYAIVSSMLVIVSLKVFSNIGFQFRRSLVSYCFGIFIVSFPILLLIASKGGLSALYQNFYYQVVFQLQAWGLPFPRLSFAGGILGREPRMYASILVLIVSGCVMAWRIFRGRLFSSLSHVNIFVVYLFAVICFRTALGRSDYGHWIDGSTLIWVLLFFVLDFAIFARGLSLYAKCLGWVSLVLLVFCLEKVHQPIGVLGSRIEQRILNPRSPKELPVKIEKVGAIALPIEQERAISGVVNYIQAHTEAGEFIYDFANQPAYYFLADRLSPTRYFSIAYALTPAMQREIVKELESKRPKVVISSTGTIFDGIDGIPSSKRHELVFDYLSEHYEFAAKFEETTLLKRKD